MGRGVNFDILVIGVGVELGIDEVVGHGFLETYGVDTGEIVQGEESWVTLDSSSSLSDGLEATVLAENVAIIIGGLIGNLHDLVPKSVVLLPNLPKCDPDVVDGRDQHWVHLSPEVGGYVLHRREDVGWDLRRVVITRPFLDLQQLVQVVEFEVPCLGLRDASLENSFSRQLSGHDLSERDILNGLLVLGYNLQGDGIECTTRFGIQRIDTLTFGVRVGSKESQRCVLATFENSLTRCAIDGYEELDEVP